VKFVGLSISPDGNLIYATTFAANNADPQIWRVPLLGGAIEEINGITTGAAVSFSPSGDKIAFTESRSPIKETHLLIADADGANKKILARAANAERSFPNFGSSPVAWSPGGGEIACAVQERSGGGGMRAGILLVNADDGSERFITERRWDYVEHLAWTDAENLAFVAYARDPWQGQIWTVSKQTGETRQITRDLNDYAWLAADAAGGNILTVQKNAVSHVSVGDFDERKERVEMRDIFKESGFIDYAAFAADNSILYTSSASGKREIWRLNADGTNPSQLTANADVSLGFSVSPVEGTIVFSSSAGDGKHSLKSIDANGKNLRQITGGEDDVFPNFTADGQAVIFQKGLNNKLITLWRVSLADLTTVRLTETHATHPAVSTDGALTAFYFMDADGLWRIALISSLDGTPRGKLSFPKAVTERRMRFFPGDKFIAQILYAGEEINLMLLPLNGGGSRIISGFGEGDVSWFEFSNDGKRIIISRAVETRDVVYLKKISGSFGEPLLF
jgi:Tol biopolymer transport system component